MAYHVSDNVYTHTFTPREYQVELLESAKKKNTIVCSSTSAAKAFIAVKLVQEYSWQMRSTTGKRKRALFILDPQNVKIMTTQIKLLTDLSAVCIESVEGLDWEGVMRENSVIVLTAEVCTDLSLIGYLCFSDINLVVIDDCLHGVRQKLIEKLLLKYDELPANKPRILGLVGGLLGTDMQPMLLEAEMQRLEKLLRSSVDTYSELVTLLRLCCHPHEHILECGKMISLSIYDTLKCHILKAKEFILDHRFDPSEIYSDEFLEELRRVPDPKMQPLEILNDVLHVLEDLGPWAADQAALSALLLIEKLKVKIPYERHYLLLCMISTVMVLIRADCDDAFSGLDEKEKIMQFTSPKVLRFLEVIKEFKPSNYKKPPEINEQSIMETTISNHNNNTNRINNSNKNNNSTSNNNNVSSVNSNNNNNNNLVNVRTGRKNYRGLRRCQIFRQQSDDVLCALVFVHNRCTAKVLFSLLSTMSQCDPDYWWVSTLYTVEKVTDPSKEPREAEAEHRRQEEVLRKYRAHECNIMIATSVLEQGCDLPKCNLVIRFDLPLSFHSYVQSKARARVTDSHYLLIETESELTAFIRQLAIYTQVENTLLRRCYCLEPNDREKAEADCYNTAVEPYKPLDGPGFQSVSLSTAIQLVNKYCAKLPSDTFTRLTPLWEVKEVTTGGYICSLRLPINSPVKQTVICPPMPNSLLARRFAAFFTCRLLHEAGELDDNLQPVGKENFKASEEDWNYFPLEPADEELTKENVEQRPGTTKRRQYYYKRIAHAMLDCHPKPNEPTYLYKIVMTLTCPLPEEQNTRGRKIYPPEESLQGFGILTCKPIPRICPFPIFTRSGEVSVSLELCSANEILTADNIYKISEFINYTFTSVLRLQRYLMVFKPEVAESCYLIAPTCEDRNGTSTIDWNFIELIYKNRDVLPRSIPDEDRVGYQFEPGHYRDAVVMPWYRNRDQPQYFYVAEICTNLNPKSSFPGSEYATFEEYYLRKYDIKIQNGEQHLLDVDHTSARLNFLTPRYVNRKGVALPTSSEETKRAKRENLEQKQILVPELCAIHPFPASLWRKAVCLPCILYRINALLLADQIRTTVALEIGLGKIELSEGFEWPTLNFGWSLLDVLKKSKPLQETTKKELTTGSKGADVKREMESEIGTATKDRQLIPYESLQDDDSGTGEEYVAQSRSDEESKDWMEIGTWSNDMVETDQSLTGDTLVRYASPTSWLPNAFDDDEEDDDDIENNDEDDDDEDDEDFSEIDDSYSGDDSDCGSHMEYSSDKMVEGFTDDDCDEKNRPCHNHRFRQRQRHHHHLHSNQHHHSNRCDNEDHLLKLTDSWENYDEMGKEHGELCGEWCGELKARCQAEFLKSCEDNEEVIRNTTMLITKDVPFKKNVESSETQNEMTRKTLDVEIVYPTYNSATTNHPVVLPIENQNIGDGSDPPDENVFSFDKQPNLEDHPGPSPSVILQALTMSNANDGINLERLETIGDSFLKYAITDYLYSKYENIHEGKLSHLRSKQVSNLNLYRLGKKKNLGECMIATKFDPHDNWLPPCFYVPKELEEALIDSRMPPNYFSLPIMSAPRKLTLEEMCDLVREHRGNESVELDKNVIPYNLVTQHSIPDKSVADCVEALIGAYLIECGPYGALLFMAWLGIRVLPKLDDGKYGKLDCPTSPLLRHVSNPEGELEILLDGYDKFERSIGYRFRDRSYLLQALTHASYSPNTLTDCYQRLEFLGDAVLDYLITRHLYEDSRMHSPGALTDLRSALVNNTIFASLAVRHGFHKYFRHLSPGLHEVVERFIRLQEESGHALVEELYLLAEHECEEVEDVEVPKALGDVFESVAGAIYLDSERSLDAVWKVYHCMMKNEIEQFSNRVPKSPIRELLELEPETAKFGTPEKLADGRRVRVTVEVFGKGVFKGIGRNYRIAKCTAAKCALKHLKRQNSLRNS